MKTYNIGFVFDDSLDRSDGIQQYITTVGRWLSEQGHRVRYLVGETKAGPAPATTHSLSRNITVNGNGNRLSMPLPASASHIEDLFKNHPFDVLHVQVPYSPLLAGRVISRAPAGTAIVGTFHITAEQKLITAGARLMGHLQQGTLRKFDRVMSVSPAAQNFAKQNYGLSSVIVPNAINPPAIPETLRPTDRRPRIVFLGRLVERKGCTYLLEAFSQLKRTDVQLIICGDGPDRLKLEQQAANLGISSRVDFLGRVEETEKYRQLAQADVAVFPSTHGESFGIVILEAMAAKSPVILGGDNPGYRSVLGPQGEHMLVDPRHTALFTRKLTALLDDTGLRKKLKTWQKQRLQEYTIDTVGPQILEEYTAAISARKSR